MISVSEYLDLLLADLAPLGTEFLALPAALGRYAAADLAAQVPVPAFTNSAMDGYAVRAEDIALASKDNPITLPVEADIPAGASAQRELTPGCAQRIMTGAPVPAGANAVVRVEDTDQEPGDHPLPAEVQIFAAAPAGANIRAKGEDVTIGDQVISQHDYLDATALAAAASTGHGGLLTYKLPRVAIVATGAELVSPGEQLKPGQIYDSNSILLTGLVKQAGGDPVLVRCSSDNPAAFDEQIDYACQQADLILTSGGVSAGAYDVVKNSGFADQLHFHKVAMQPGKPQGFARLTTKNGRTVNWLALPGNPVSVFVSWQIFGRAVFDRLSGAPATNQLPTSLKTVAAGWKCPNGRAHFLPVVINPDGSITPSHKLGSGSHLIASLQLANGLAVVPAEVEQVAPGGQVPVLVTKGRHG